VQQSILPTVNDHVVVDLSGATILHDNANYDTISSFTVTASNVTVDLGAGTLDLSGGGGRGLFQVDQPGDAVTMEGGVLRAADVTSGTTLTAIGGSFSYPELNDVQLDGPPNANQNGNNNGIYFQNGLILNGTINLGGSSDLTSVLLAGYHDFYGGSQDNNPETLSGAGTIQLGQSTTGDAIVNGTLGAFTIGPNITILGGGPGSIAYIGGSNSGVVDNQGTIKENGGSLQIAAFSPARFGLEPSGTAGWTNEGTIEATGATLSLLGGWINSGTISADSSSTVILGTPTLGQLPSDPNAAYYAWSSTGSLTIGAGANVVVGGFLTTDQYQGAATIPGVSADFAQDSLSLLGTLDNTPADNSVSGGVLALTPATEPLQLIGGTVYGGSITSSDSADVQVSATITIYSGLGEPVGGTLGGGHLDNLTNNGTVDVAGLALKLTNVTNSGAVNGTSGATVEFSGSWNNTNGSISVDSTSSLYLGPSASTDPNFPFPTLADSAYAWDVHSVGTIQVANGATIGFGGLTTTDTFTAFPRLPGVSIDLSQDKALLDGWLDNSPADNPVTGGVLAFTGAIGAVDLAGGFISQGTITGALNLIGFGGPLNLFGGVLDSVTNDGAITVSNTALFTNGNTINNGTLVSSFGGIFPGGSFTNNGSVNLKFSNFQSRSSVVNNGSITANSSYFQIQPPYPGYLPVILTNSGAISAVVSSVGVFGNWDNTHGAISADYYLSLGYTTLSQVNFPTLADGSGYAFDPSKVATLNIADGATFGMGGLLTTDQWNAFPSLPGVSIHLASDRVLLTGWLDNSPADNPTSGGVLAITSATGPLYLDGGYIYRGKITTSGPDDLANLPLGILDDVELDGNLNIAGYGSVGIYVENNINLHGTIDVCGCGGSIDFGFFDTLPIRSAAREPFLSVRTRRAAAPI
jgi:hypothetical protein